MARGKQLALVVAFAVLSPDVLKASFEAEAERIDPRGCARRDLTVSPNGRILTKVVAASGTLPPRVEVELFEVESLAQRPSFGRASDDEFVPASGVVHWTGLPPGRYVMGVNITQPATKDNPYPPMFYPGVRDISAAQVFELGFAQQLELPTFTLPAPPPMLEIRGSIVRTDSRAVGGISVFLDSAEPYSFDSQVSSVQADKGGRFSFTVPAGSRYRVKTIPWNGLRAISEPFELTPATAPILLVMRPHK